MPGKLHHCWKCIVRNTPLAMVSFFQRKAFKEVFLYEERQPSEGHLSDVFPSLTRDKSKNDIDTIMMVGGGSFCDSSMIENLLIQVTIENLLNQVRAKFFVSNDHFVTCNFG